jgi:biotin operon repressor
MNPGPAIFGQVPVALLRDPDVPAAAKALYGLLHSYCSEKVLLNSPWTHVSQKTLAKDMGVDEVTIWKWMKPLKQKGWVGTVRRGHRTTNKTTLLYKRQSRASIRRKAEDELLKVNRKILNDFEFLKRRAGIIRPDEAKNT